jgi:PAS domain S-box-containing protein
MSNVHILVVEDEAIVAEDLSQKLKRLGYEVSAVTASGEESIELVRRLSPSLVLMDIRLAGRIDGVEAAQIIRRQHDVAVIYLTAHSDSATLERAKLTEPFGYILKPFEELELETHIQMALYKHKAERELRQQRELFRVTLQSIGDAVLTTDAAGRIASLNPVAEELTKWTAAEAVGRPLEEVLRIVAEADRTPAPNPAMEVLREGRVVGLARHTLLVSRDGEERAIEDSAAPIKDSQGRVLGVVVVFHDVTDKRRSEEALRQSEEQFRALANSMPNLAWWAKGDGYITWYNQRWFDYTGTTPPEMEGWGWQKVHNPEVLPQVLERWRASIETGEPFQMEFPLRGADGRFRWFLTRVMPVRDATGKVARWFGTNTDVTEARETQQVLARGKEDLEHLIAERTAKLQELVGELEHFSYTITHDMRAPLRAMRAFGDIIVNEMCASCPQEQPKDLLKRIVTSAERMDALIRDALDYSRSVRQELPLEAVDTQALLRDMLNSYPEFQSYRAQIQIEGELPLVIGNKAGLTQCFSNLLANAVKFVKPGQLPEIRIRAEQRDGWARIWIEDKGVGIPTSMLLRVFDLFSRGHSNYGGTGVGLALVRKVVDRMKGRVGVESQPDIGSQFWLELRTPDPTPPNGAPAETGRPRWNP